MKYLLALFLLAPVVRAQQPAFHVLAFYSETVERDHVDFAHQAIKYYTAAAQRDHFDFASTTNWDDLNVANLAHYELILWLDDQPHTPQQRASFEEYMKHGGGWLGFHIAAYNDRDTQWPWLVSFHFSGISLWLLRIGSRGKGSAILLQWLLTSLLITESKGNLIPTVTRVMLY